MIVEKKENIYDKCVKIFIFKKYILNIYYYLIMIYYTL